jgi:prepilin-type processing-associated H-X9-DG protein
MANRSNGENAHRAGNCSGISRVGVVATLASIALLIVVCMLPGLNRSRDYAQGMVCESNLKMIGIAFRTWEQDYNDLYPMRYYTNADGSARYADGSNVFHYFQVMTNAMTNEFDTPRILACPSDVRFTATDFAHLKSDNISYFVSLDADETWPAMLLSGDRNLVTNGADVVPGLVVTTTGEDVGWSAKMHNGAGNFVLADGSVQRGSSSTFQMFVSRTGTNLTRLLMP